MVNTDLNKKLAKHQKIDSDEIRVWLVVSNSFGHNWEKSLVSESICNELVGVGRECMCWRIKTSKIIFSSNTSY